MSSTITEVSVTYTEDYLKEHLELKARRYTWQYHDEPDSLRTALRTVFRLLEVVLKGGVEEMTVRCS